MASILDYQSRASSSMESLTATSQEWMNYYQAAHERRFVEGLRVAELASKAICDSLEAVSVGLAYLVEQAKLPLPPLDLLPPSEN